MKSCGLWPIVSKRDDCADLYFQQDGAPAHYAVSVRKWIDEHFPGRWISHRGAVEWPARSPNLTPLDFFLWEYSRIRCSAINQKLSMI